MSVAPAATIRVESESRWDALDLARRLDGLHTYLVQLGNRRWLVCVRADGDADEVVALVLRTAAEWAAERHLDTTLHVGERVYEVRS